MPTGLAGQFLMALFQSHYVWFVCAVQIVGGVLLLMNRYVPLALMAGDFEYYFVSPAFESCGCAVGGRGDHLLVIFVLLLPATFFWIIRAEGNVSE
jgi:hypothetical protein